MITEHPTTPGLRLSPSKLGGMEKSETDEENDKKKKRSEGKEGKEGEEEGRDGLPLFISVSPFKQENLCVCSPGVQCHLQHASLCSNPKSLLLLHAEQS